MRNKHNVIRRQKPVEGGRRNMGAGMVAQVEEAVEREAARWKVSRSFVIHVAVADALGIKVERY